MRFSLCHTDQPRVTLSQKRHLTEVILYTSPVEHTRIVERKTVRACPLSTHAGCPTPPDRPPIGLPMGLDGPPPQQGVPHLRHVGTAGSTISHKRGKVEDGSESHPCQRPAVCRQGTTRRPPVGGHGRLSVLDNFAGRRREVVVESGRCLIFDIRDEGESGRRVMAGRWLPGLRFVEAQLHGRRDDRRCQRGGP